VSEVLVAMNARIETELEMEEEEEEGERG